MFSEKKVVGYVRSLHGSIQDCDMQEKIIKRYSHQRSLGTPIMFTDMGFSYRRAKEDIERERKLGIEYSRHIRRYPAWEEMLIEAMNGKIGVIIVDRRERLYRNNNDLHLLEDIVQKHNIQILEVENLDWPEEAQIRSVAVYHYFVPNTRRKGIRTANLMNDIRDFYEEIAVHADWRLCGLYIDSAAFKKKELPVLWERSDVDVIICKYFYHMNRKTLFFLQMVQELNQRGITLVSTEEGVLRYYPGGSDIANKTLRVATYDCCRSEQERITSNITKRRMDLFCRSVPGNWNVVADYREDTRTPAEEFNKLTKNPEDYDLVMVESFARFGTTVNELMDSLRRIGTPVFSLKEGLLYTDGKKGIIQSNTVRPCFNGA